MPGFKLGVAPGEVVAVGFAFAAAGAGGDAEAAGAKADADTGGSAWGMVVKEHGVTFFWGICWLNVQLLRSTRKTGRFGDGGRWLESVV